MVAHTNMSHPRIITHTNGEITYTKFPMTYSTGNFIYLLLDKFKVKDPDDPSGGITDFDQLGLGITMYFKLLKSMIILLIIASCISSPLLY